MLTARNMNKVGWYFFYLCAGTVCNYLAINIWVLLGFIAVMLFLVPVLVLLSKIPVLEAVLKTIFSQIPTILMGILMLILIPFLTSYLTIVTSYKIIKVLDKTKHKLNKKEVMILSLISVGLYYLLSKLYPPPVFDSWMF